MENRRPDPEGEDTDNSTNFSAVRAEGIAAWLHMQRQSEQHRQQSAMEKDDDDDEDDPKTQKTRYPLKFGSLPLKLEEKQTAPAIQSEQREQVPEEADAQLLIEEQQLAALRAEEEDFRLWEEELKAAGPEIGGADMQMSEQEDADELPPQKPATAKRTPHEPRQAASVRHMDRQKDVSAQQSEDVPPAGGGGGGDVPPSIRHGMSGEAGDDGYPYIRTPNIVPENPNVHTTSRELEAHEHHHGHPRLAAGLVVGLLVEHGLRKRADRKIKREMRKQNDMLHKQIKRGQEAQDRAQQSLEAKYTRLSAEQELQRQTFDLHAAQSAEGMNREAAEQASLHKKRQMESFRSTQADMEARESLERTSILSTDMHAESHTRPKIVMEQVAAAAENDMPVERVYERRQEVKDEPSTPAGAAAGGAASVGSVLAKSPAAQHAAHYVGQPAQNDTHHQDKAGHAQMNSVAYRAAVLRGVGAAVAFMVLALLAYLLL